MPFLEADMVRIAGIYEQISAVRDTVNAFVPAPLPPANPPLMIDDELSASKLGTLNGFAEHITACLFRQVLENTDRAQLRFPSTSRRDFVCAAVPDLECPSFPH